MIRRYQAHKHANSKVDQFGLFTHPFANGTLSAKRPVKVDWCGPVSGRHPCDCEKFGRGGQDQCTVAGLNRRAQKSTHRAHGDDPRRAPGAAPPETRPPSAQARNTQATTLEREIGCHSRLRRRDIPDQRKPNGPRPSHAPPSIVSVSPVMNPARSDARNATASATSPGLPQRLSGTMSVMRCTASGESHN